MKQFIYLCLTLFLLMSNLVYAADDLENKFKVFTKKTNSIKKKFDSLPASTSSEAIIIDAAIQEMDKVMEFVDESFKNNNIDHTNIFHVTKSVLFSDEAFADIRTIAAYPRNFGQFKPEFR